MQDRSKRCYIYTRALKLSQFGRNTADILQSIKVMQSCGVELQSVKDNVNSAQLVGQVMIPAMSAFAQIEVENIHTQTMSGRYQKAKEGKWNGGFAPCRYKLENGKFLVDEKAEVSLIY